MHRERAQNMRLNVAQNIKRLRKEAGLTQEALSEKLGVSSQSVSRWELGICYPDLELLPSIANFFGVSVDVLLNNDAESKERDEQIFQETFWKLSDKTTEKIVFVREYCHKYPENDGYAYLLMDAPPPGRGSRYGGNSTQRHGKGHWNGKGPQSPETAAGDSHP